VTVQLHPRPSAPRDRARRISWWTTRRLRRKAEKGKKLSAKDSFVWKQLVPGDVAIDCGANVGDISQLMASRGALVHSFEPDPLAFGVLSKRFAGVGNVTCHNVAVSNRAGRMRLYLRKEYATDPLFFTIGSTLDANKTDVDRESFVEVDVVRLADFIAAIPRVRLLKLDIEGAEIDVLSDLLATGLLSRIDLTVVETHETWIPDLGPRLKVLQQQIAAQGLHDIYFNWT
jgi:FkbM family methyltransferase